MAPVRVLVVDDEPEFLQLATKVLSAAGFDVTTTESEWALAMLMAADRDTLPFDVLVTDLWMPQVSGATLIERTRALGMEIPVLVLSGDGMLPDAIALRAGLDDFLGKPFRPAELVKRVVELVERTLLWRASAPPASTARKGTPCTQSGDNPTATS